MLVWKITASFSADTWDTRACCSSKLTNPMKRENLVIPGLGKKLHGQWSSRTTDYEPDNGFVCLVERQMNKMVGKKNSGRVYLAKKIK